MKRDRQWLANQAKRGGARQRREALQQLQRQDVAEASGSARGDTQLDGRFDSKLGRQLVKGWAWGRKSAVEVQRTSSLAYADEVDLCKRVGKPEGHCSNMLKSLASLGTSGDNPGNANKELKSYLGEPNIPKADLFDIHTRVLKPRRGLRSRAASYIVQTIALPFLLPHILFHDLYSNHTAEFARAILPENVCVGDFWGEVASRRDPRIQTHPMISRSHWHKYARPLSPHGDGVAVLGIGGQNTRSLDCISWTSSFALGPARNMKEYIYIYIRNL